MKTRKKILMNAVAIITILATSQIAAAWLWTNNPLAYGHDTDPNLENCEDGNLLSDIEHHQGEEVFLDTLLYGSTEESSPTIIEKTEAESGLVLMWVTPYTLHVERAGEGQATTKCSVKLDLYYKDDGQGQWNWEDDDTDSIIINYYEDDPGYKDESGWLYVWFDCSYDDGDQFKLVATASCEYFNGYWIDVISPVTTTAFYEIEEIEPT